MESRGSDGERGQRWRAGAAMESGGSDGERGQRGPRWARGGRRWARGGRRAAVWGADATRAARGAHRMRAAERYPQRGALQASRYLQSVGGRLAVGGARGEVVEEHVTLDEVVVGHALAQRGGQAGRAEERIEDAHRPPATHRCSHEMHRRGKRAAGGEQAGRRGCTRCRLRGVESRRAAGGRPGGEAWEGGRPEEGGRGREGFTPEPPPDGGSP